MCNSPAKESTAVGHARYLFPRLKKGYNYNLIQLAQKLLEFIRLKEYMYSSKATNR